MHSINTIVCKFKKGSHLPFHHPTRQNRTSGDCPIAGFDHQKVPSTQKVIFSFPKSHASAEKNTHSKSDPRHGTEKIGSRHENSRDFPWIFPQKTNMEPKFGISSHCPFDEVLAVFFSVLTKRRAAITL